MSTRSPSIQLQVEESDVKETRDDINQEILDEASMVWKWACVSCSYVGRMMKLEDVQALRHNPNGKHSCPWNVTIMNRIKRRAPNVLSTTTGDDGVTQYCPVDSEESPPTGECDQCVDGHPLKVHWCDRQEKEYQRDMKKRENISIDDDACDERVNRLKRRRSQERRSNAPGTIGNPVEVCNACHRTSPPGKGPRICVICKKCGL